MAAFEVSLEDDVTPNANKAGGSLMDLAKQFQGLGGESDSLVGKLANIIDPTGTLAIVAAAAGAAVEWLGEKLYEGALKAIAITQQKDALLATFGALAGGAAAGQATLDMLSKMSQTLPFTTKQLSEWAKGLLAAGIQGQALETAVRAVASATAIMGEAGGAAAETLIKRLAMTAEAGGKIKIDRRFLSQLAAAGVSVQALAKELGIPAEKLSTATVSAKQLGDAMQRALIKQGKGPLGELGLTWDTISAKINEGINSLFADLGPAVKPFMKELQSLASEFFKGGVAAGQAKSPITSLFKVVFEVATRTVRAIHLGFLQLEIMYLRAKIALKPVTSALDKLGVSGGIVNVIMYLLAATGIILAVVFGVLAVAVFLVVLPFLLAAAVIGLVIYGLYRLGSAISDAAGSVKTGASDIVSAVSGFVSDAIAWLANLAPAAVNAGAEFMNGLWQAIIDGGPRIISALIGLAGSMAGAITKALGIASRSKVMYRIGGYSMQGLIEAHEDGADDLEQAARGAGAAAVSGASAGMGAGATGGGSRASITIGDVTIAVNGGGKDWREVTREALAEVFEEAALQAGV